MRFSTITFLFASFAFSYVAAAPLLEKAPTHEHPWDLTSGSVPGLDFGSQNEAKDSFPALERRYNPPDTCGCVKRYLQCLASLGNADIDICNFPYFTCNSRCPGPDAVNKRDEEAAKEPQATSETETGAISDDSPSQLGATNALSPLEERYNPPDSCGCVRKYLQCLANLGSQPIEICNFPYFNCNSKCPGPDAVNKRDDIGSISTGFGAAISGSVGKSHHHKQDKRDSITLPSYTVVAGDTLYNVAKTHNVALDALVSANPQLKGSTNLSIGQYLNLPGGSGQSSPPSSPAGTFTYKVAAGDTLYLIAKGHGVPLDTMVAANPQLNGSTNLSVGQVLNIPIAKRSSISMSEDAMAPTTPKSHLARSFGARRDKTGGSPPPSYTVVEGDTLYSIAMSHNMPPGVLIAANPQLNGSSLSVGQNLTLPTESSQLQVPNMPTYTVKSGDALYQIAEAHGVSLTALTGANPQLDNSTMLTIGQVLNIPAGGLSKRSETFCDCASIYTVEKLASCIGTCRETGVPEKPKANERS